MASKGLLSLKAKVGIASLGLVGTGLGAAAYQYYTAVPQQTNVEPNMVKVSELPLYGNPKANVFLLPERSSPLRESIKSLPLYGNPEANVFVLPEPSSPLRDSIKSVRIVVWEWLEKFEGTRSNINDKWEIGKAHTQSTIDMLQSNPSTLPRIGFIAGAGVTGMLIGYRGNIFKKGIYGTVSTLAAASLCYPEETVYLFTNKYKELKASVLGLPSKDSTDKDSKEKADS